MKNILNIVITIFLTGLLLSCTVSQNRGQTSIPTRIQYQTAQYTEKPDIIWHTLQHASYKKLNNLKVTLLHPNDIAWLELALISKQYQQENPALMNALTSWQIKYPNHPGNRFLPKSNILAQFKKMEFPRHIAVLLPQSGPYGASGKSIREGFLNAYYQQPNIQKQTVKFYDTNKATDLNKLYQQALTEGADVIIGPLLKKDVQLLTQHTYFSKPILALNYTEERFSGLPKNFYEYGLLPEDEASEIANRVQKKGFNHAIIISANNNLGKRASFNFTSHFQANGGEVKDVLYYSPTDNLSTNIAKLLNIDPNLDKQLTNDGKSLAELKEQRRSDFDTIILFADPDQAKLIIAILKYYYAADVPIYAAPLSPETHYSLSDKEMAGITVCDIPFNFKHKPSKDRLFALGKDAYTLSQQLTRLVLLPHFPIYGETGALTLSPGQKIHRRLPCRIIEG